MLMLMLTAREGRLSANQTRLSVIVQFPDAPHVAPHVPRRRIRVSRAPARAVFLTTKSAILRAFYISTNTFGLLLVPP